MKDEFEMHERDLDRELISESQMQIRRVVRALPDEELSLAWRSQLNDRLRSEVARKKKRSLAAWVWKPTAGVALAGALAIAFMLRVPSTAPVPVSSGVEKAIVNTYVEGTASWAVAADGVTATEVKESSDEPLPFDFEHEDVGATL